MAFAKSLPVLMHHYISNYKNTISVSPTFFEEHCRAMAENGWRGVSLAEAESFFINNKPLPKKSALITFDDGYLDNYFNALPILKKYGHAGVMFAVTDRLEPTMDMRASLGDVLAGNIPAEPEINNLIRKNAAGFNQRFDVFCTQGEAKAMDADGTMAVAGHSKGHLGVYVSDEFTGFTRPGDQGRSFYLTSYGLVWGMPCFPVKPGLAHRAFLPAPELVDAIKELVPQDMQAAKAFFEDMAAVAQLEALVAGFKGRMGRFETDDEQEERMAYEIVQGKTDLEALLGHSIQTLCWPWGAYSKRAIRLALDAGYKVLVTVDPGMNTPKQAHAVRRFKARPRSGRWLLNRLEIYSRPLLAELYLKLRKL